jgi:uncharacterized membrane protein YeaQ/YmgE (transglycosylase-associated protein family)
MFNFVWWFVAGPIAGFLTGRLMRAPHGWIDALTGLLGAILVGTVMTLAGLNPTYTEIESVLIAAAGGALVAYVFRKVSAPKRDPALPKGGSRSYTSYKSRMGKE